ncbi:hypothetical protein M427DRAFT_58994 [Gonapodya prolifera JEL478]|uniref:BZIP domain-containing protein n=1 Tax=Gonapodya prolifera (strain JEL478) TaxID=1344416 RepID=A0A139A9E3_GONPJ|nr:hypothetical protein M427DRAFT_58994 [Gonapodya prolifera JEL478]|eukprot:KXS13095.1 hypothetical protein M427DRAFT_58994 [Gonapodya prolifera JEL478]
MSLSYMMPNSEVSLADLLNNVPMESNQNWDALFGSILSQPALHQDFLLSQQANGFQDLFNLVNLVQGGASIIDYNADLSNASGYGSPSESENSLGDSNPFAALVIPVGNDATIEHQASQFALFPSVNCQQAPTNLPPDQTSSSFASADLPKAVGGKREHRGPSVTWQAARRAPSSTTSSVQSFSPVTRSMPSPPLSPTTSVKDEAPACAPSPTALGMAVSDLVKESKLSGGGIRTPFDDMNDEELDDLDEDDIMGMMGKSGLKRPLASADCQKDKKKRKRRSTAELAPQELEVRRIKNSEAARRCRLRKTLKLRWLEARCSELEETNVSLMSRLADLEARLGKP